MPMTPAEAAAFRLGLEAGARECERSRSLHDWMSTSPATLAAAIRALPVPAAVEVTEDAADSLRDVLRQIEAINDKNGYNPEIGMLIEKALPAARGQS